MVTLDCCALFHGSCIIIAILVFSSQQNSLGGDVLPGESYVSGVVMGHVGTLSAQSTFTINLALKHVMHTLVTFATDLAGYVCRKKNLYISYRFCIIIVVKSKKLFVK